MVLGIILAIGLFLAFCMITGNIDLWEKFTKRLEKWGIK